MRREQLTLPHVPAPAVDDGLARLVAGLRSAVDGYMAASRIATLNEEPLERVRVRLAAWMARPAEHPHWTRAHRVK